ncbi:unnamed protein product [Gordionus sp. m RMFG-2023]|uniref:disintegrin and metalloproteinase domain-containing protein 10-like n=1 Tax=Gordionus sp. m RMFG-2023 TaxID=3053472 RepID=UPI0030DFDA7E
MIKLILCCLLQLREFLQYVGEGCPSRGLYVQEDNYVSPDNIPFKLKLISLTDVVEMNASVEIKSDLLQYENSYLERYLTFEHYYVAKVKDKEKSYAFGSIDIKPKNTLFDGIIYVDGKLNFIEGGHTWESFNSRGQLVKSALSQKWGMRKWVENRKYLYYTEDDVIPLSHVNDYIKVPYAKSSFVEEWKHQVEMANQLKYTKEWYNNRTNIKKVCRINVFLDSSCMEKVFQYNIKKAIHEVIILYGSLDFLYRIIDFAGIGKPNHFGFQIAKITIAMIQDDSVPRKRYMKYISSIRLGDNACLGISSTFRDFGKVLGKAYLGSEDSGIFMDDSAKKPKNLNMAFVNYRHPFMEGIMARGFVLHNLAHEVGHSFGAIHEEELNCTPSSNLLMQETVDRINEFNKYKFSPCNVELMKKLIETRMNNFMHCKHLLSVYYDSIDYSTI